ncbi:MAG: hypothetical protein AAF355_13575 [Myxococcota bacterium]
MALRSGSGLAERFRAPTSTDFEHKIYSRLGPAALLDPVAEAASRPTPVAKGRRSTLYFAKRRRASFARPAGGLSFQSLMRLRWNWMWSRWGTVGLFLCVMVPMWSTGCHESVLCGGEESCDYLDNDCDDRVDENFRDEEERYTDVAHCGGCGVRCSEVFPTAEETACQLDGEGTPGCVLVSCPAGFRRSGAGSCAPEVVPTCLPCTQDEDCDLRLSGSRCESVGGELRCLPPCGEGCDPGFSCNPTEGLCQPDNGACLCVAETLGASFACLFSSGDRTCAGVRSCGKKGLGPCEAALVEACNGQDDDCDGSIDESFVDASGSYISAAHCGACGRPCVEPGPNTLAECLADSGGSDPSGVICSITCLDGFIDVDGFESNGCECERFDGQGAPPIGTGDLDCDGVVDDDDSFIYVSTSGSDGNPGTLASPMRTLGAAVSRGQASGRDVLVARGIYDEQLSLVAGVSVFGGYRTDFRDRDLDLYPTALEYSADPGAPVVLCTSITSATQLDGFLIIGSDASIPGEGSTTVYSDGCSDAVLFGSLVVQAGRGADGLRGSSSAENLGALGFTSLAELDGPDGASGRPGTPSGSFCAPVMSGVGGSKSCGGVDVGGGDGGFADCPNLGCVNGSPCGNAGCTDYTVDGVCDLDAALATAVSNPAAADGRGPAPGLAGEVTYSAPTNRGTCNFCDDNPSLRRIGDDGEDGGNGQDGASGAGCAAPPQIDFSSGRVRASNGTSGTGGTVGSGGGGGTGGAGYSVIGGTFPTCFDRSGGSGGGGGAGGCGAPGAEAGRGGGSSVGVSIRLLNLSGPSFDEVRILTASGGAGGDGGAGASGGAGGSGGNGGTVEFFCSRNGGRGGDGGSGGSGGGGGGGCGGGSHGIFLAGTGSSAYLSAVEAEIVVEETGVAGLGGAAGSSPSAAGGSGATGSSEAIVIQSP